MSFMVLEIWLFGFGTVLDIFLEEFVLTLDNVASQLGRVARR